MLSSTALALTRKAEKRRKLVESEREREGRERERDENAREKEGQEPWQRPIET